jgi:hypothetical protein
MLAIGAADDCIGALGMADPLDVLEYLRCTRPYFVTCRRAVDEDACLKQGKMRLTIITRNIFLNRVWCRRRPPLHQGDLPRAMASTTVLKMIVANGGEARRSSCQPILVRS